MIEGVTVNLMSPSSFSQLYVNMHIKMKLYLKRASISKVMLGWTKNSKIMIVAIALLMILEKFLLMTAISAQKIKLTASNMIGKKAINAIFM